jgi:hypothetical protein
VFVNERLAKIFHELADAAVVPFRSNLVQKHRGRQPDFARGLDPRFFAQSLRAISPPSYRAR